MVKDKVLSKQLVDTYSHGIKKPYVSNFKFKFTTTKLNEKDDSGIILFFYLNYSTLGRKKIAIRSSGNSFPHRYPCEKLDVN